MERELDALKNEYMEEREPCMKTLLTEILNKTK